MVSLVAPGTLLRRAEVVFGPRAQAKYLNFSRELNTSVAEYFHRSVRITSLGAGFVHADSKVCQLESKWVLSFHQSGSPKLGS